MLESSCVYARADLFLLSSQTEGLPTVLIEPPAFGFSVVSTDCPSGTSEILADERYGRLAPVGALDVLANAVSEALADPTPSDELRQRVDEFPLSLYLMNIDHLSIR